MKITELTPGFYKVKEETNGFDLGIYRGKNYKRLSILRVVGHGEKRLFFFNNDTDGLPPHKVGIEYEVVKRYEKEPQISNCKIILSFKDDDGDEFEFPAGNALHLRNIFQFITWLCEPFGYVSMKRNR